MESQGAARMRKDSRQELLRRLDELQHRIESPAFRHTTRSTNTMNYWVFDYDPRQELEVRNRISYIQKKCADSDEIHVLKIDLYERMVHHLEQNGYLDQCVEFEAEYGMQYLVHAIKNSLRITADDNFMMKYITEIIGDEPAENTVVLLTGIGKCFPLLQGPEVFNQILYNMPSRYSHVPMVLFYPGTYTEQELIIFNEMKEDNYYRAYRIVR